MTRRPSLTKVIADAIAGGLQVTGAEIFPDGRIKLTSASSDPETPYDAWKKRKSGEGRSERPA